MGAHTFMTKLLYHRKLQQHDPKPQSPGNLQQCISKPQHPGKCSSPVPVLPVLAICTPSLLLPQLTFDIFLLPLLMRHSHLGPLQRNHVSHLPHVSLRKPPCTTLERKPCRASSCLAKGQTRHASSAVGARRQKRSG